MTDTFERAQQILADIREPDPKKPKAWEWVCRAYEARGFTISQADNEKHLMCRDFDTNVFNWKKGRWTFQPWLHSNGELVGKCAPLFEDLNAMREFEMWLYKKWKEQPHSRSYYLNYYDIVNKLLENFDPIEYLIGKIPLLVIAPADVRLAAWCAVMLPQA